MACCYVDGVIGAGVLISARSMVVDSTRGEGQVDRAVRMVGGELFAALF